MELLYIWIEDYKNIYHQGFNFSPKHKFEFEPQFDENDKIIGGNLENKMVNKDPKNYLPDNFFGKNIVNVTGIVGKNGVGKTNLIRIINLVLAYLQSDREEQFELEFSVIPNFVLVIKEDNFRIFHKFKSISSNLQALVENINLKGVHSVILSNAFYENELISNKIYDLSTYSMIKIERTDVEKVDKFFQDEFKRQWILSKNIDEIKPVKIPNSVVFSFNPGVKFHSWGHLGQNLNFTKKLFEKKKKISFLLLTLIRTVYYSYSMLGKRQSLLKKEEKSKKKELNLDINFSVTENEIIDQFILKLKGKLDELNELIKKNQSEYNQEDATKEVENNSINFDKIIRFIENIKKYKVFYENGNSDDDYKYILLNDKIQDFTIEKSNIYFKENGTNFDFINDFIEAFQIPLQPVIEFYWPGLSSGELAYFNLFSRFYSIKDKFQESDNLLVFIDEGELYFHPQWQTKFVSTMKNGLSLIFKGKIQLILTSHSPFIVSDLPAEHILFLEKDKNGNSRVIKEIEQKQTFGANIHTLFTSSFFMEGLMGDFAKEKIDDVIDYLNGKESTVKNELEAEQIIKIIGEPILRNQLQRMLDSKRLKKLDKIDEIDKLRERIKTLEGKKK